MPEMMLCHRLQHDASGYAPQKIAGFTAKRLNGGNNYQVEEIYVIHLAIMPDSSPIRQHKTIVFQPDERTPDGLHAGEKEPRRKGTSVHLHRDRRLRFFNPHFSQMPRQFNS
jgi:hypothetical protein